MAGVIGLIDPTETQMLPSGVRWAVASRSARLRDCALATVLVAALILATPTSAPAVTEREIAQAKAERAALQKKLDASVAAVEAASRRLTSTQESIEKSQARMRELEAELDLLTDLLSRRASSAYRQGFSGYIEALFDSVSPGEFARKLVFMEKAAGSDSTMLFRARRLRAELEDQQASLDLTRSQERITLGRIQAINKQLAQQFESARALEAKLLSQKAVEEQVRREAQARAARAAEVARRQSRSFSPGSFACPMDGPNSFRDSWGEPRSGGRRHQGVDIFAAHGTPIVAVVDGTISRMARSSLGGISLYLQGLDGTEYFYTHLSGYSGISQGQRVSIGTRVAYNGNSGNARGGAAHLHFEIHPGGGAAINPYPTVRAACR